MVREKVKYLDGTEVEIEIERLGFRKANQLARKHIPINDLTFGKDESVSIKGDIDLLGMTSSCLELIKGLDLDKLEGSEGNRIYKEYFEKDLMSSLGQGGNPN